MTEPGPLPGQTPGQRAEDLKRRHIEMRRRQTRRRRAWLAAVLILLVLAAVAGYVVVRALGLQESTSGPPTSSAGATALASPSASGATGPAASASTAPSASPSASTEGAGDADDGTAASPGTSPAKTPPATPTGDATPTGKASATAQAEATDEAALQGTPSATPSPSPSPKPTFAVSRALADVRTLVHIGVRSAGGGGEKRGGAFIARRLRAAGATPETRTFRLPNGRTSHNVVARFPGATRKTIILGAHMDSKAPSPGANDNGTGCGALLEIARCLARRRAHPTIELVFFGSEEMIDANPDHHHFGSRFHVKDMSAGARKNAAGMISVDMIGYGPSFVVRSMKKGPQTMVKLLLRQAKSRGVRLSYLRDPGESGWSDHEAFELAGIPAAWIEWRDDPVYHTAADTSGHLVAAKMRTAGQLVLSTLYRMDESTLEMLAK